MISKARTSHIGLTTQMSGPANQRRRRQQTAGATALLGFCFVLLLSTEQGHAFTPECARSSSNPWNNAPVADSSFRDENDSTSSFQRRSLTPPSSSLLMATTINSSSSSSSSSSSWSRLSNADLDRKIVGLGRKGKTDEALKIFESIDRPNIRIINGAIDACARARPTRLKKAFEILEEAIAKNPNLKPNVFTFGSLLNACNRARNVDKAMQTLRSMEKEYGVVPNAIVYSSAISACARSEPPKPELALKLLREVVEEKKLSMSVVGFNAAISACAQASDWENAISLLTRMEEATINSSSNNNNTENDFLVPEPDVVTYGTVLAACERGGQWKLILKKAESMRERGLPLDGLSVMTCLHACAELGLAYEALRYLDTMKSVEVVAPRTARYQRFGARKPLNGPDAVAYRCAISACARGGAWREGIQLLEECKNVTGTPANTVAYTAAITGCEYAGEWKEAFFLLDKMRKEGVEPNEHTMGAVIGACATACGKDDEMNAIASGGTMPLAQKKAIQLLSVMKKDPNLVKPNIQVYNAAIRVCAEARDSKRAFRILQDAQKSGIERTQFTYGALMTACERIGCVESASKAFRMMREDGIKPNEIIYGAAISCCRKAKEPKRALLLLRKMISEELSPNAATINTVMLSQTDSGKSSDSEKVLQVYKIMQSEYVSERGRPNRYTYNILINFFADAKQPATAEAFLDKMRKEGFKPDVDLFTKTVTAYERAHQPLKALNLMERMQNDGYDFYGNKVLNEAFKKAVRVVNAVGQNFAASDEEKRSISRRLNRTDTYDSDNHDDDDDYDVDGTSPQY